MPYDSVDQLPSETDKLPKKVMPNCIDCGNIKRSTCGPRCKSCSQKNNALNRIGKSSRLKGKKYGSDEKKSGPVPRQPEDRFWEKVDKNGPEIIPGSPCWVWTGAVSGKYGIFDNQRAHRFSFALNGGVLTESKPFVLHECDNRMCVRFEHLKAGDHQENMNDAKKRYRWRNKNNYVPRKIYPFCINCGSPKKVIINRYSLGGSRNPKCIFCSNKENASKRKGIPLSDEHRKKISESCKLAKAKRVRNAIL